MPFTDSDPAEDSVAFMGLWIHDPLNPADTAQSYLYGGSIRSSSVDTLGEGQHYAGRTFPVWNFGEHQEDSLTVVMHVPHGDDWATDLGELLVFAESRRTLCFRDNRSRLFFGVMQGYSEDDQAWGTAVSFDVARVSYDEGEEVTI